jgi:hypothetical protein
VGGHARLQGIGIGGDLAKHTGNLGENHYGKKNGEGGDRKKVVGRLVIH